VPTVGGNIGTPSGGFYLGADFYYSQNTEGNYSTISSIVSKVTKNKSSYKPYNLTGKTATLKVEYLNEAGSWVTAANLSDNSGYDMRSASTITLVSGSNIKIPHKSNGKQTIRITAYVNGNLSNYYPNGTVTGSVDLTDIPRATTPNLNPASVEMGKSIAISLPRAVSAFTHTLYHDFQDGVWTQFATGVGTEATLSVPASWASRITDAESGVGKIRCLTYSGDTLIGEKIVTFTAAVPKSVIPTVSKITITEAVEGLASKFGAFIQNKSQLRVVSTASGASGSTIKNYSVEVLGVSYTGQDITTYVLTKSGTVDVKVTVTDSRGRIGSKTAQISVLEYFTPTILVFNAFRSDQNGNEKNSSKTLTCAYKFEVAPCGNKNSKNYKIEYRRTGTSTWTTISSGAIYSADTKLIKADVLELEYPYEVRLTVSDYFTTNEPAVYIVKVGAEIIVWCPYPTGKGMGVLGYPTREAFQVFGESDFKKEIFDRFGTQIGNGLSMHSGSGGNAIDPDSTLEELILTDVGTPIDGTMFYIRTVFHETKSITTDRAQTAIPYSSSGSMYHRCCYNNAWTSWRRHVNEDEFACKELWSGAFLMQANQTITLSEAVSKQKTGIVISFSYYTESGAQDSWWHSFFVPKQLVMSFPGKIYMFSDRGDPYTATMFAKQLYISDNKITGADVNSTNYTSIVPPSNNYNYVLRKVYGV